MPPAMAFKACRKSELPSALQTLKEGWYYIFAFFLLITLLVYLKREAQAPFFATAALLILSQFGKLKPNDIWFYVLAGTSSSHSWAWCC